MNGLSLYEIGSKYLSVVNQLEELDLDDQTFSDTLEGMQGEVEVKATNVIFYAKNKQALIDAREELIKKLQSDNKKDKGKVDYLKQYVLETMVRTGITKIECPQFVLSVRKNPPSVDVLMQDLIPDEYFDIPKPPPPTLNKKRLAEDLKAGVVIEGARLTQGHSLQIK